MADEGTGPTSGDLTLEPPDSRGRGPRRRALWGALAAVVVAAGALVVVSSGGDDGPPTLPVSLAGGRNEATGAMAADMALAYVHYVAGDGLPALGGEAPAYRLRPTVEEASVRSLAGALGLDAEVVHDGDLWHVTDGEATLEVDGSMGSWWFSATGGGVTTSSGSASGGGASSGSAGCEPGPAVDCAVDRPAEDRPDSDVAETTVLPDEGCTPEECVIVVERAIGCVESGGCATAPGVDCGPDADCTLPTPVLPEPPADLPSSEEARSIALDLLRATGAEVDDAEVTVSGPGQGWFVSVQHARDGMPVSGWSSAVVVGSKGGILMAFGMLAEIERLGDYPLLETRAAIDRLNAQQGDAFGGGATDGSRSGGTEPGVPVPETAVADAPVNADASVTTIVCADTGTSSEPGAAPGDEPTAAIAECVTPEPCVTVETAPAQEMPPGQEPAIRVVPPDCEPLPMPEPVPVEPVEVVLTTAEPALVLLSASDGSGDLYLVPGYRLGNDDGTEVEAAAVADEALAPTTTGVVTETTGTPEPAPVPTDCEVLVEDDGSGTTHTVQTCPPTTTTIGTSEPRPLEAGESPTLGVPYRVELTLHCVHLVDWDGRWWSTDAVNPPTGWTGSGTFTLTGTDTGTYVDDGAPDAPATFTAQGERYPGCA